MTYLKGWLKTGVVGDPDRGALPDFRDEAWLDYATVAQDAAACLVLVCAKDDSWTVWAATDGLIVYLPSIDPEAENEATAEAQAMGATASAVDFGAVQCPGDDQ